MGDFDETAARVRIEAANRAAVDQVLASVRDRLEQTLSEHPLAQIVDVKVSVRAVDHEPWVIRTEPAATPKPQRRRDRFGRWLR
jgi:hypothetical protein